jgi:hypothetical protein
MAMSLTSLEACGVMSRKNLGEARGYRLSQSSIEVLRKLMVILALLLGMPRIAAGKIEPSISLTPDEMRTDLLYLRDTWAAVDKSQNAAQRVRFAQLIADSLKKVDAMTPADFALDVCRAVAVSQNLHSGVDPSPLIHQFPIRAWWFSDGLYIIRADPKFKYLLGAKVEQIGSIDPEGAIPRVAPFISGIDSVIRTRSAWFLTSPEVLHRIGATVSFDRATFKVLLRDGSQRMVKLETQKAEDPDEPLFEPMKPARSGDPGGWDRVVDAVENVPLQYQPPKNLSWAWIGNQNSVLYIRSTSIWGDSDRYGMLTELFDLISEEVVPRRPKYVIVDLRFNTGGDFFNTVMFSEALPKLISAGGRIFVLVGPNTISAALVTAAMLKGYGRERVELVGDFLSDHAQFWSESSGPMRLPQSNLLVTTATRRLDWENGCSDLSLCSWGNVAFGHKGVLLVPEIRITPSFADYASGRDPVLDRVLAMSQQ